MDSQIIDHWSYMLTLCIQFGVVPDYFQRGVLILIPKKAGCDTTQAKNWRPITVSSTFSKLLELYVLEESSMHEFSDLLFFEKKIYFYKTNLQKNHTYNTKHTIYKKKNI